ncbi:hypothetical protein CDL12_08442 [Handroanthus impetiginosus]|uniref:Uncharacterized protein n=1 Tax=Handroanthus impetiginosus TaxID=429701 RepID=A0A2G9HMX1_9LAMI|nr:hypothetical protein CDL12_08442 [Handroanthus impetiginosus]
MVATMKRKRQYGRSLAGKNRSVAWRQLTYTVPYAIGFCWY